MPGEGSFEAIRDSARIIAGDHDRLLQLWRRRGLWQIKVRWGVAPLIVLAVLAGRALGFRFEMLPILLVAASTLVYNFVFLGLFKRAKTAEDRESRFALLTTAGIVVDYAALLCLLYLTGGVSSPLLAFMVFHVVIAAIQFPSRYANAVAAVCSAGLWLLLLDQVNGWLPARPITLGGEPVHALDRPVYLTLLLAFFTATLFMTVAIVGLIMRRFRHRAVELASVTTQLGAAKDVLERHDQERTQFMLQVAHNLRAPLGAGLSMLGLVRDGTLGPLADRQADSLERIDRRLKALNQTVGEILTIAKTRDWSREITDTVVDLRKLARYTETTFKDAAAAKGLLFRVTADDDLPLVDSGVELLEKVMDNLVSNAIKYTPHSGEVDVRFARCGEEHVRITVRDTGIGIPKDQQDRLFEEFFRATNAKEFTTEGTGLGLALVKRTVDRHKGRVDVVSQDGKGTTVIVELPVRQPAQPA